MSKSLKFYYDLMSQPSRALYIFLKLTRIPFEECPIALRKGIHLSDEFKNNVNRFQKLPAIIVNDEYKLSESVAIFRYLIRANANSVPDHWYPKNNELRGKVDEYLEWQHVNTRTTCSYYFILKYLKPRTVGKSPDDEHVIESAQKQMDETLNIIENIWLNSNDFLAGKNISIADILAACELEQPRIAGYEPGIGRPRLQNWLNAVKEQTNPFYNEAHVHTYKLRAEAD